MKKEAEALRAAALAERLAKIREEVDMQPRAKVSKQRGERPGEFDDFIDEAAARDRLDQKKRPKDRKRQRYGGEDEAAVLEGIRVFLAPSDDEGGEADAERDEEAVWRRQRSRGGGGGSGSAAALDGEHVGRDSPLSVCCARGRPSAGAAAF